MIKMAVNAGTFAVGGGRALKNLDELANLIDKYKSNLTITMRKAGNEASKRIKQEVIDARGGAGRGISVTSKKYGPFGLKISITANGVRPEGSSGSTEWSDPVWAGRIFLASESGDIGRKAFVLAAKEGRSAYRVSRSSGRWTQGQFLRGPLNVPQIGAYYFSGENQPIRKDAYQVMLDVLDEYHYNFIVNPRGR